MQHGPGDSAPFRDEGAVLVVSCYELGHPPMGIASPLAHLEHAGYRPACLDLAVESLDPGTILQSRVVLISVPMHTALRLGIRAALRVREINPDAHVSFFGLYAGLNKNHLLETCAGSVIGEESEEGLVDLVRALERGDAAEITGATASAGRRPTFRLPSRSSMPPLSTYAMLEWAGGRLLAGHVAASRGCLHLCRHCPIPPVYRGRFFAAPREIVLADIRQQVAMGARHITFGDPDFLNGPTHALRIVRAMHEEFPELTFDFTAKIEHIVRKPEVVQELGRLGALFAVSAVESLSDEVLIHLAKGHTAADARAALQILRGARIAMRPTFVPFTPWESLNSLTSIFDFVDEEELIDQVDPVQYSVRLLVPPGSLLAEHPAMRPHLGPLDPALLGYRWIHPDPRMDELQTELAAVIEQSAREGATAARVFDEIRARVSTKCGIYCPDRSGLRGRERDGEQYPAPRLTEPWFC